MLVRHRTEPLAGIGRQLRLESLVLLVGEVVGYVGVQHGSVSLPAAEVRPMLRRLACAGFLERAQLLRTPRPTPSP